MDHLEEVRNGDRPGCLLSRLPGKLLRLVLIYPIMSMGSQGGRWVQTALRPGDVDSTPYEGALLGLALGLMVGVGLWRRAIGAGGWRSDLSQLTLAVLTAIWLVAAALVVAGVIAPEEALIAYAAALTGGAAVLALMQ